MGAVASLVPTSLSVDPGSSASLTVRVRNTGTIVERFALSVAGAAASFARIDPPVLSLFPGQEGDARITFSPSRESSPRAGEVPFAVRVAPDVDPSGTTVEEGRLTIGAFTEVAAEIVPQTSRGSRVGRHEVVVENRGNTPVDVTVRAADPDRLVTFTVDPPTIALPPGGRGLAAIRAAVRDTFLLGAKQSHPFLVEVRAGSAPAQQLRGAMLQGPLLPSWLLPVGGIAALAIVALIAVPLLSSNGPPRTGATSTPLPTVSPTPSPTPEVTLPPEVTPAPTPTPGPFELVFEGGEVVFGGALSVRCPPTPSDSQCRREALDTVRALATSLGGGYGGKGIVSTENVAAANTLAIILRRDVAFPWVTLDSSASDQTERFVVDIAPLLASPPGFAYAVVDSAAGPRRFVVPDELAGQLLDILYERNPVMVDPLPVRTIPPFFTVFDPGDLIFRIP